MGSPSKEPKENIGVIHEECSKERHAEWQKNNGHVKINVTDFVKLGFKCVVDGVDRIEHMWVKVTQVADQNKFIGTLNNDPVIAVELSNGDEVMFDRTDIEEHIVQ